MSAQHMFNIYYKGPFGHPELSYRALDECYGSKWRNYCPSACQAHSEQKPIFNFIERSMVKSGATELSAVAALHELVIAAGHRGASKAPNWKKLAADLKKSPEEIGLKAEKAARQAQIKAKKSAATKQRVVTILEDGPAVLLNGDGTVVEEEGEVIYTTDIAHPNHALD